MQLSEAIKLIQHPLTKEKNIWADLGCGNGLFTNALSQLLVDDSLIYAVDKNKRSLQHVEVRSGVKLEKIEANFVKKELPLKNLSGLLMANSFHFIKNKNAFVEKAFTYLNDNGYCIMVEYDTDKSNLWVPYPLSFYKLEKFFSHYNYSVEKLYSMPSRYDGTIYSALINKQLNLIL